MNLKIDGHTLTKDVLPLMTSEEFKELVDKSYEVALEKSLVNMSVGEWFETLDEDYISRYLDERYILDCAGKIKSFRRQQEAISNFLKHNEIPETPETSQAKIGIDFPSFKEAILIEICEFFHLDDLEKAGNVPVSQWLIIHRNNTAKIKFEHNLNKIYESKQQLRNRR